MRNKARDEVSCGGRALTHLPGGAGFARTTESDRANVRRKAMPGNINEQAIEWLRTWGSLTPASALMLTAMFVVASFVFVPRTFLYLGVGAVFGLPAIPIVLPSTTVGSVLAFLAARYLFANRLRGRLDRYPRFKATAEAI